MDEEECEYLKKYYSNMFGEISNEKVNKPPNEIFPSLFKASNEKSQGKTKTIGNQSGKTETANQPDNTETENQPMQEEKIRIDLHGFTTSMAPIYVMRVLMSMELHQTVTLRFVVGQGHNSADGISKMRLIVEFLTCVLGMEAIEEKNKGVLIVKLKQQSAENNTNCIMTKLHFGYLIDQIDKNPRLKISEKFKKYLRHDPSNNVKKDQ